MKKIFKSLLLCMTAVILITQPCMVSAEEIKTEVPNTEKIVQSVTSIANKLEILARYDEVNEKSLYKAAVVELIKQNPELYEPILDAMLSSIDENSAYYNENETKQLMDTLTDEVTGIGVTVLMNNGNIIVSQPIPNSPAEKAGIRAGDIIIGADDVDLKGLDFDMALDYIRGPVGTTVNVRVLRSGISEPLIFSIVRERVVSNPVEYEVIEEEGKKIARIIFYSFTDKSYEHFKEALERADKDGIKNIIIDLRNNGGGYLDQAVMIADLFLGDGKIITVEDHKIEILNQVYTASGNETDYDVVILVNGMSASSSEVLTAALSENGVARVIGERTFGKGTVQTIADTQMGGVIKYTSAYYLTPNGNNIHGIGIVPDAEVINGTKPIDMSEFSMFSLNKKYTVGDVGEEVKNAKKMLECLGFFIGEINDIYDENLKIAVNTYQQYRGLYPYGVLDITTQLNLYETMREVEVEVDDQLRAAIDAF